MVVISTYNEGRVLGPPMYEEVIRCQPFLSMRMGLQTVLGHFYASHGACPNWSFCAHVHN